MRKGLFWTLFIFLSLVCFSFFNTVHAEDFAPGRVIPKLPKTINDPVLTDGKVYPFLGPLCQRYTYSVIYSDKNGRPPQYIQIYFNGQMINMEKEDPNNADYQKGVKYIFQNVPTKYGSNFYYFEASNGLGKARASIIDSPDNGPVLFDSDFKNNEIVVINTATGKVLWRYSTGAEWVGAVALSNNGQFLAAQTSNHVYLFNTQSNKPLWSYQNPNQASIGGDVKGGVAISADGKQIFAAFYGQALYFHQESNRPVWSYNLEPHGGGAYGVDISQDGLHAAIAMAGSESDQNTNVLILLDQSGQKLWQYHASGNWHEVSFSQNGQFLAGSTGCPDRRGYLFSINSPTPIIRSEPLSQESPIDEARISQTGSLAVYGAESGYGAIILMDQKTKKIVWKYDTPMKQSVRALAMTPDAKFIGAGTFGGDVLLFQKNSNQPIEQININSAIGAFDLSDNALIFVTGSADKKVRIFHQGENRVRTTIPLNEYVGEIDVSANGQYVAAGTSGAVYFFESIIDLNNFQNLQESTCAQIIEPPPENTIMNNQDNINQPVRNDDRIERDSFAWPIIILICIATVLLVLLITYLVIPRIKKLRAKKDVS